MPDVGMFSGEMQIEQEAVRFDRVADVLVVGGGSAGFMAAMALKTKLPRLNVTVVRSPEIGIIGVGEGSTPPFTRFIHEYLGIFHTDFAKATLPGFKTGTCFMWGPRDRFFFPLGPHMDLPVENLSKPIGYYYDYGDYAFGSPSSARMAVNKPFDLTPRGQLLVHGDYAYHIENDRFTAFLEMTSRRLGVEIVDGTIDTARQDDRGVSAVVLSDGRTLSADLYIDCSGFRSLLLGQTLREPRTEYGKSLFCDRAVVGGWARPPGEPILSYTLSETMDAGWCWRIEHPDRIHRGYVYSSAFISDEAAERELRTKNPRIGPTRIVKFRSGRFDRSWVKNVLALGNASGFVEPLEATSLAFIASRCQLLVSILEDSDCRVFEAARHLYNDHTIKGWDVVRDFLSLHYRFNTRLDTEFWRHCRAHTDLAGAAPVVEYYRCAGPSPAVSVGFVYPGRMFGISSYLTILCGMKVPSTHTFRPSESEVGRWNAWCRQNASNAATGVTAENALSILVTGRQVTQ